MLDLRILNCDRNESNIIFRRNLEDNSIQLYPIDHGLALPDTLELYDTDLCWLSWQQTRKLLRPELRQLVEDMDPERDYYMMRSKLGIREACLRNFRFAETFIKKCVQHQMSLFTIAQLMYRSDEEAHSPFQRVAEQAEFMFKYVCGTMSKQFYLRLHPRFDSVGLPSASARRDEALAAQALDHVQASTGPAKTAAMASSCAQLSREESGEREGILQMSSNVSVYSNPDSRRQTLEQNLIIEGSSSMQYQDDNQSAQSELVATVLTN